MTCGSAIEQRQGTLDAIADSILFINPIITHLVVLVEGLRNKQCLEKCWINLQEVDHLINKKELKSFKKLHQSFIRKQYWNIFFAVILSTYFELKIICTIKKDNWYYHWMFTEFSHVMVRVGNLIYIFYIDLITFYLKLLNSKLMAIADLTKLFEVGKNNSFLERVVKSQLKDVMKAHFLLKNTSDATNKAMEWSQLFNMCQNLIGTIMDFYFLTNAWLFMSFHRYGKDFIILKTFQEKLSLQSQPSP